jgi:RNA polymerase sigma-70 factor, ECF subfamily
VGEVARSNAVLAQQLLDAYPHAVDEIYSYLIRRTRDVALAEDLTSATFMDAVVAIEREAVASMSVGWLVTVARRRLIDHWRRREREERKLALVAGSEEPIEDPWGSTFDAATILDALARVRPAYRAALTLRYLDGLPIGEVADVLGRSVPAAESLLQRARGALRLAYTQARTDGD